jgi:hypothetical protein
VKWRKAQRPSKASATPSCKHSVVPPQRCSCGAWDREYAASAYAKLEYLPKLLADVHVQLYDALIDFSLAPIPAASRQAAISLASVARGEELSYRSIRLDFSDRVLRACRI